MATVSFAKILRNQFNKNNQVLLGYKKRGFGVNRWNGFGGKESSLIAQEIVKVGILCFDSDAYSCVHEAHVLCSTVQCFLYVPRCH
uniref:Uncharacterized protein n=1 Tax=Tetranychus urticae TaxID=32264 RepID=T1KKY1_TETUR